MTILKDKLEFLAAEPNDWQDLADLQIQMAWETEKMELNPTILHTGMQALLTDPSKGKYYKVVDEGKIVGCLMNTFEWSEWRNGYVLWIQSLYLLPDYRGKGLYRAMYEAMQTIVRNSANLRGIRLYVDKSNQAAIEVYKSLKMNNQHYEMFEWMKE